MSNFLYKSHTYTYSYTVRILKRQQLKRKQPFFGNYPKELLVDTTYNTFDGFIECTRIPYIVRKSLIESYPWGTLEVVLKKREEPVKNKYQRPKINWTYTLPKGY
jgi:hypothetical protein